MKSDLKKERIKVRKQMRTFYHGLHSVLKAAGCWADKELEFDSKERRVFEKLWKQLDTDLSNITTFLTQWIVKDRNEK